MGMHNISEILSVELGSKISDICKPILNKMGFNYFCFSRIYKDDSRVLLTNNVKLTKWFLENDFAFGIDTNDSFRSRKLKAGMVLTIEPGIYIPKWKTGIRIEDDILVTRDGYEILSIDVPKEVKEIELLRKG